MQSGAGVRATVRMAGTGMTMKNGVLFVLAAMVMLIGMDAAAVTQIETPRMRRFGPAEGLPSRMVLALTQDRQGAPTRAMRGPASRPYI